MTSRIAQASTWIESPDAIESELRHAYDDLIAGVISPADAQARACVLDAIRRARAERVHLVAPMALAQDGGANAERLMRGPEVLARLGVHVCEGTLRNWVRNGKMPRPQISPSGKTVGWRASEIDAWILLQRNTEENA